MSASTVPFSLAAEEMFNDFTIRIRELETLALLRINPSSESDLRQLANELSKAEVLMEELSRIVEKDQLALGNAKKVARRLKTARSRTAKLDRHLTMNTKSTGLYEEEIEDDEEENSSDLTSDNKGQTADDDDNTITVIEKANQRLGPQQVSIPMQKQFESVPKYMRSLMSYEEFKRICELVNLSAERKRLILEAPAERLGPNARVSLATWKTQVTDDLNNLTFVTEDDVATELENEKNVKASNVKAALQCLRNLDFVRVSPYQHINRYVFLK